MADDDIEIVIEDDPPVVEDDILGAPAAEAAKPAREKKVVAPEDGVEVLRGQLAAQQAETAAANQRAAQHAREAAAAKGEVQDTNVSLVETTIASVKADLAGLEAQLADAYAGGDFTGAAKLQGQMARKAAEQLQLETGLEGLKSAPKPAAAATVDPVEHMARQLTDASAAWIRAHPQFASDPTKQRRLIAAHNLAETDGLTLDSPEYFAAVEKTLGIGSSDARPAPRQERQETPLSDSSRSAGGRTETQPASLPPSRAGNGDGSSTTRVVRLTREQAEAAAMSGMTVQEYAKEVVRLEKDRAAGRIQ